MLIAPEPLLPPLVRAADIKKARDAGFHTAQSLIMYPKKVWTEVKGLSEAKVEKMLEAAFKVVPGAGWITGTDSLLQVCARRSTAVGLDLLWLAAPPPATYPACRIISGLTLSTMPTQHARADVFDGCCWVNGTCGSHAIIALLLLGCSIRSASATSSTSAWAPRRWTLCWAAAWRPNPSQRYTESTGGATNDG